MEYKIAICDDEQKDRDFVAALSRRWAGQRGNTVELTEFSSAEQFLFCYGEQSDYDILLLDIEMGQMDDRLLRLHLGGVRGGGAALPDEAGAGGKVLFGAGPRGR